MARLTALGDTDIYLAIFRSGRAGVGATTGWRRRRFRGRQANRFAYRSGAHGPFDLGVGLQPHELGEYVTGVASDASGNFYIAGSFRGVVDFDPGAGLQLRSSAGGEEFIDIFLLKLNSSGNFVFVKQIGGEFTDVAQGLAVSGNSIFLTGYYTRIADFDPSARIVNLSTLDHSRENVFVARYDSNGALTWVKDIANNDINRGRRNVGNAIAVNAQGNSYIAGSFSGETDFDPSARQTLVEGVDETDAFVLKLNSGGNFVWVKTFGGEKFDGAGYRDHPAGPAIRRIVLRRNHRCRSEPRRATGVRDPG